MIAIVADEGIKKNFAIAVEIDDDVLTILENDVSVARDIKFMTPLATSKGDNLHIVSLNLMEERKIIKQVVNMLKEYKSVSWIHDNKFFIRRK